MQREDLFPPARVTRARGPRGLRLKRLSSVSAFGLGNRMLLSRNSTLTLLMEAFFAKTPILENTRESMREKGKTLYRAGTRYIPMACSSYNPTIRVCDGGCATDARRKEKATRILPPGSTPGRSIAARSLTPLPSLSPDTSANAPPPPRYGATATTALFRRMHGSAFGVPACLASLASSASSARSATSSRFARSASFALRASRVLLCISCVFCVVCVLPVFRTLRVSALSALSAFSKPPAPPASPASSSPPFAPFPPIPPSRPRPRAGFRVRVLLVLSRRAARLPPPDAECGPLRPRRAPPKAPKSAGRRWRAAPTCP